MTVRYPLNFGDIQRATFHFYDEDDLCGGRVPGFEIGQKWPQANAAEIGQRSCPPPLKVDPLSVLNNDTYEELIEEAIAPSVKLTGQRLLIGAQLDHATFPEWSFSEITRDFGTPTACVF